MQSHQLSPILERRSAAICLAAILVTLFVVRAPFLFYIGMSTDAYNNGFDLPPYDFLASQGRQGSYLLIRFMDGLGIYGPHLQYLNVLLGVSALSVAAFYLFRTIFSDAWLLVFAGSVLFLAHPYQAEILTFRDAFPFYATASMLGCAGYYLSASTNRRHVVAGIAMIIAGLTIYQSFVNFLAMAWLLEALLLSLLPAFRERRPNWNIKLVQTACSALVSMLIYFAIIKALDALQGTAAKGRATFINLDDVPSRAQEILFVFKQFAKVDLISPAPVASGIVMALASGALALLLVKGATYWRFAAVPVFSLLLLLCSVGLISLGKDFWPMPRTLVAVALIPAFAVCVILTLTQSRLLANGVIVLATLLVISFIGLGTRVAVDQVRINHRDALFASSLAARVSLPPGTRLAIVGGPNNALGLTTVRGDMNISAYWARWSKVEAISENIGYQVDAPNDEEWNRSVDHCNSPGTETWPGMRSVQELGNGLVVVCLSRP